MEKLLNSYKLETISGQPLDREFHACRLQKFTPREEMELATQQKKMEAQGVENLSGEPEIETELEPAGDDKDHEHINTNIHKSIEHNTMQRSERRQATGTSPKVRGPDGTGRLDLD